MEEIYIISELTEKVIFILSYFLLLIFAPLSAKAQYVIFGLFLAWQVVRVVFLPCCANKFPRGKHRLSINKSNAQYYDLSQYILTHFEKNIAEVKYGTDEHSNVVFPIALNSTSVSDTVILAGSEFKITIVLENNPTGNPDIYIYSDDGVNVIEEYLKTHIDQHMMNV